MNIGSVPRTFASAPLDDPETGSLSNLRDFLKREWRLICLITLLSIAPGGACVAFSPSRFTAQADMRIDTKKIAWKQSEEMASEVSAVDDATVESEMETTKSEKIAKMVVERLRLTEDPEFVGSGAGLWSKFTGQLLTLLHLNGI